jgi:soluble lytic murein transglycosylase-like protein
VPVKRRTTTALCVLAVTALAIGGQASVSRASAAPQTYVVKPGDTLTSIASRYGTTVSALASANKVRNPNVIVIGTRLAIPAGQSPAGSGVLPAKLRAHPDRVMLRPLFEKWASTFHVAPDLLEALAWVESGWQTSVVSRTGAIGIGQLEPATVAFTSALIGMQLNPYSPNDNIRMSARFLRYLLDRTGNNVTLSVGAYYQGLRSIMAGIALPDTWLYVAAILASRPSFA